MHTYVPTCLPTYIPTYLPAYICTYVHTYVRRYIHICAYISGWLWVLPCSICKLPGSETYPLLSLRSGQPYEPKHLNFWCFLRTRHTFRSLNLPGVHGAWLHAQTAKQPCDTPRRIMWPLLQRSIQRRSNWSSCFPVIHRFRAPASRQSRQNVGVCKHELP